MKTKFQVSCTVSKEVQAAIHKLTGKWESFPDEAYISRHAVEIGLLIAEHRHQFQRFADDPLVGPIVAKVLTLAAKMYLEDAPAADQSPTTSSQDVPHEGRELEPAGFVTPIS